jgi:hypothetical protein
MASFTDQIQTFNPYVSQAPLIEAMVSVGTQKQQQYDQGVQKIQGYIDNIAGMDVVNDADKKYLQSKLNDLGSKLKIVAAGDFSNQQLVNSVGGMATQVIKDPLVQNAVSSTAWYRKQLAEMEKAIAEGKSSQANIKDFTDRANTWLSGTTPGSTFRDRYTPYRDLNKTAMEAIKALHPKLQSLDMPYVIKDGKINIKEIADAIQRQEIKGIDEGQIETAIRAVMTPDDYNQLGIDARYQFSNVTADDLVRRVDTDLQSSRKFAEEQIQNINTLLPKYATDPDKTGELIKRRKRYEDQLGIDGKTGTLDAQAFQEIESIKSGDIDSAKYSIYKDGFFKQFGNAFAWKEEKLTFETNPLMQVQLKKDDQALDRQREARLAREFKVKTEIDLRQLGLKETENYLKQVELGLINPNEPTQLGSDTDNKLKSGERLNSQIDKATKNIDDDIATLRAKGLSEAKITEIVADYAKNGNKSNVNPAYIPSIQSILKGKKNLDALSKLKETTRKEAEALVAADPKTKELVAAESKFIDKNFNNPKKVPIRTRDGVTLSVSEADLFKLYKRGDIGFTDPRGLKGGTMSIKWGGKTYNVESPRFGAGTNETVNSFTTKLKNYRNQFDKQALNFEKDIEDKYLDLLAPRVSELVPTIKAVNYGKEQKLPVNIANNLSALITAANTKDIAADNNYSTAAASKMLTKENIADTRVFVQSNKDGTYIVTLKNDGDPKNLQNLKLTAAQVVSNFGPQYLTQNADEALLLKLGRGTTNVNDDPKEAQYQSQFGDFPNLNNYQVLADLDEDTKNPGQFVPKFYALKKDGTYQTFVIAGRNKAQRLGLEQAKQQFNTLTDDDFIKLIKTEYPKYDFSNLYQK